MSTAANKRTPDRKIEARIIIGVLLAIALFGGVLWYRERQAKPARVTVAPKPSPSLSPVVLSESTIRQMRLDALVTVQTYDIALAQFEAKRKKSANALEAAELRKRADMLEGKTSPAFGTNSEGGK